MTHASLLSLRHNHRFIIRRISSPNSQSINDVALNNHRRSKWASLSVQFKFKRAPEIKLWSIYGAPFYGDGISFSKSEISLIKCGGVISIYTAIKFKIKCSSVNELIFKSRIVS